MIEPTHRDVGRSVVFLPYTPRAETGIISSFNGNWVYVQFGPGPGSTAASRNDLFWPEDLE